MFWVLVGKDIEAQHCLHVMLTRRIKAGESQGLLQGSRPLWATWWQNLEEAGAISNVVAQCVSRPRAKCRGGRDHSKVADLLWATWWQYLAEAGPCQYSNPCVSHPRVKSRGGFQYHWIRAFWILIVPNMVMNFALGLWCWILINQSPPPPRPPPQQLRLQKNMLENQSSDKYIRNP